MLDMRYPINHQLEHQTEMHICLSFVRTMNRDNFNTLKPFNYNHFCTRNNTCFSILNFFKENVYNQVLAQAAAPSINTCMSVIS